MLTIEEWVLSGNPVQRFGSGLEPDPELMREFGPVANSGRGILTIPSTQTWIYQWFALSSVCNGFKSVVQFQVPVGTELEPLQQVLPHEKPGLFQLARFPPEITALASPAFSPQFTVSVLIVLRHEIYVHDAVFGALSHAGLWLWICTIFVVYQLKTRGFGMILIVISQWPNKYWLQCKLETRRWKSC